ncbi:hypothetical protein AB0I68_07740 [Streptomyces sp. NPDC050448]|uniref:hypothetical protein n=1 Tax=Streptomyces sp. NPDC050448 TaxID=3155404 RepID=UPI00341E637E
MRERVGVVLAVLLVTAGCGAGAVDQAPGAARAGSSPEAGCVTSSEVVVTTADNGHRVCLDLNGTVRVSLPGSADVPVTVSGTALAAVSDHVFRGVSAGQAVLTATIRNCPGSAAPGAMSCAAMSRWQVTVVVG